VGYAAVRVARRLGLPVVIGATGSDVRCIPDPWTRRLVKATLREADFVVAKSGQLREEVLRLGAAPGKVAAIRNGCDGTVFHPGDRAAARRALGVGQGTRLIVFTGRLVAVKGVQELIAALGQLRGAGQPVELALIGDGPLEASLRRRCEKEGLAGAVRFLGALSQREVARWLTAADVFCLPSYSEGCPNVVLEALACGRPVVATQVGGVPEITSPRCAILVPPADAGALAAALRRALDTHWDEAVIAAGNGRTWTDMARETYQVCAALAAGHCPAPALEAPAA
jgi:teichuronic acid biosynthesis glycosyltransferase TuaC